MARPHIPPSRRRHQSRLTDEPTGSRAAADNQELDQAECDSDRYGVQDRPVHMYNILKNKIFRLFPNGIIASRPPLSR
jgi:hypothetical protein